MVRRVFYSFHYERDNWRAAQVRNIRTMEGNQPARDNDWEAVTRGGEAAIERWIARQMKGRSCTVVLVGITRPSGRGSNMRLLNHGMTAWVLSVFIYMDCSTVMDSFLTKEETRLTR